MNPDRGSDEQEGLGCKSSGWKFLWNIGSLCYLGGISPIPSLVLSLISILMDWFGQRHWILPKIRLDRPWGRPREDDCSGGIGSDCSGKRRQRQHR